MDGEDLTQGEPSQPASPGPGEAGKSADPANGGELTPERMKSWEAANNNKAQQLAQQQKQLEADRAELDRHKASIYSPGGQPPGGYGYGNQMPGQGYGQAQGMDPNAMGQPGGYQGQQHGDPNSQDGFAELVNRFGYEDAVAMRRAYNQDAQAYQSQIQQTQQLANNAYMNSILSQIDARGVRAYGDEWDERGEMAKELIVNHSMLGKKLELKDAMEMARARSGYYSNKEQEAIDKAHQNLDQKSQSQVSDGGVAPPPSGQPIVETPDDAFNAAWDELGGE